jgi:hypothetical protein
MVTALLPYRSHAVLPGRWNGQYCRAHRAIGIRNVQSCSGYPGGLSPSTVGGAQPKGHDMDEQRDLEVLSVLVAGAGQAVSASPASPPPHMPAANIAMGLIVFVGARRCRL